jgi:hypothetical protein
MGRRFARDIWLAEEPIAALAVGAVDGERPKPPSPRFPVWNSPDLHAGAFPCRRSRFQPEPDGLLRDAVDGEGAEFGVLVADLADFLEPR